MSSWWRSLDTLFPFPSAAAEVDSRLFFSIRPPLAKHKHSTQLLHYYSGVSHQDLNISKPFTMCTHQPILSLLLLLLLLQSASKRPALRSNFETERDELPCLYIYSLPSSSSFFFYITPSLFLCMCFVLRLSSLARALKDNHAILTGRTCASSPYLSTLCVCKHTPKASSATSAAARERERERASACQLDLGYSPSFFF